MKRIFASLMLLVSCLTLGSCIYDEPETEYEIQIGDTIPDFEVTMNDGSKVTGASLREGVAVIMFFHSSCPDCRQTLPSVQRIYDEFKDKGVSFALISRAQLAYDSKDAYGAVVPGIQTYWDEVGYTMPYSAQPDRTIYNLFATTRVPRVYVCSKGKIVKFYTDDPIMTYEELLSDLESLL